MLIWLEYSYSNTVEQAMAIHMEVVILTAIAMEVKTITMAIPMEDTRTIKATMGIRTMGIRMKVQIRKSWKG